MIHRLSAHLHRHAQPAGPFERAYVVLEPARLAGLAGVYDVVGIGGNRVVLRIIRDGDRLLPDGPESDGELFPMHESELVAMSDTQFAWPEWAFEVEFERSADGLARSLTLRAPKAIDRFHGVRRPRPANPDHPNPT